MDAECFSYLGHLDVFVIAERHDLVKGKEQLERVLDDLLLLGDAAVLWDDAGEEVQGLCQWCGVQCPLLADWTWYVQRDPRGCCSSWW